MLKTNFFKDVFCKRGKYKLKNIPSYEQGDAHEFCGQIQT